MFKFCSLYSGSTGNSLFVETPNTKILIDAGESAKKLFLHFLILCWYWKYWRYFSYTWAFRSCKRSWHTFKKYNIPVYANNGTWQAMPVQSSKIEIVIKDCLILTNYFSWRIKNFSFFNSSWRCRTLWI